eukprot:6486795-Amphidinium_carterae.1
MSAQGSASIHTAHEERPAKMQKTSKGAGKSKPPSLSGSSNKPPQSLPSELTGQCWKTSTGAPLCFSYNVGKCDSKKKDGQRCSRGWHLCAFKLATGHACGAPHPFCKHA